MQTRHDANGSGSGWSRRGFMKASALGAGGLLALPRSSRAAPTDGAGRKPNFLFIVCDQLSLNAIATHGCVDAYTPNLDRLVQRGVTFMESHSTNPVCSPARSSMLTGAMPVETGVISNSRRIHDSVATMGEWFSEKGYDCVYCGKWHLPEGFPAKIAGFRVIPVGMGQGDLVDNAVARLGEGYLANRSREKPFVLVASLKQPHDICYWAIHNKRLVPAQLPFPGLASSLPALPPNNGVRPRAPARLDQCRGPAFSKQQWQYYRYIYFRQVEMLDADVGRLLGAAEHSGEAANTIVIFTSDHGEGAGCHDHVQKWYPYDEAAKVPMIVSCPGRLLEGRRDTTHLVSGLDIMSTMCDYAGISAPPRARGRSLRPLLEGKPTEWREFVVSEHQIIGRMVRTEQFKFVRYKDDPVQQLFDMKADPWEMKNLYDDPAYADIISDHGKLLDDWVKRMVVVRPTPIGRGKRRKRKA